MNLLWKLTGKNVEIAEMLMVKNMLNLLELRSNCFIGGSYEKQSWMELLGEAAHQAGDYLVTHNTIFVIKPICF